MKIASSTALFLLLLLYACQNNTEPQNQEKNSGKNLDKSEVAQEKTADLPPIAPVLLTGIRTEWSWSGTGISAVDSIVSVPGLKVERLPKGLAFNIVGDIGLVNLITLYTPEGQVDLLVRDAGSIPVPFRLKDKGYSQVQVVGDMNNWDSSRGLMVKKGKVWELIFPLPPGNYRYRFVIDGQSMTDPKNPNKTKDEQGQEVSVYQVKAREGNKKNLPTVELSEKDGLSLRLHLPKGGAVIALLNNRQLKTKTDGQEAFVELPPNAKGQLRIYVQNEAGLGEPLFINL